MVTSEKINSKTVRLGEMTMVTIIAITMTIKRKLRTTKMMMRTTSLTTYSTTMGTIHPT